MIWITFFEVDFYSINGAEDGFNGEVIYLWELCIVWNYKSLLGAEI
jgi:hypothetical protein